MNRRIHIVIFFLGVSLFFVHAEENYVLIKLSLENKKFDSLRIATSDTIGRLVVCRGKTSDFQHWEFKVPFDTWNGLARVTFGSTNYKASKYEYIKLLYHPFGDEKSDIAYNVGAVPAFVPDWNQVELKASYINSDTVFVKEDRVTLIYHNFRTTPDESSSMEAWTKCSGFSMFTDNLGNNSDKSYEENLFAYKQLLNEYPDSRLLLISLHDNIRKYHTVSDARSVFNLFSSKCRSSFWGKQIENELLNEWNKFENISMKNIRNNQNELIVKEHSKYTLLCFTASWCVYCRKEIPVLKEIYNSLPDNGFEMVSVSLDDSSSIQTFKDQIGKDILPWRILSAYPLQNEVSKKYAPNGIPVNILIFPDRHIEYMDVRDEMARKRLIELIGLKE
jgi:thiol-disulfide isomerase/thioredoxin